MSTPTPHDPTHDPFDASAYQGAVIVGLIPGQNARVVREAAEHATLYGVPLVGVYVDTTRFVTYEEPGGSVHSAALDLSVEARRADYENVVAETSASLEGTGMTCVVRELVGDPAFAIRDLADDLHAKLIVIGTRKPGIGETLREFITGSVAARLARRQKRSILVIPQGDVVDDDAPAFPEH